jgi:S1-C subfamily serine protease
MSVICDGKCAGTMRLARTLSIFLLIFFLGDLRGLGGDRADAFVLTIERIKHSVFPILCGQFNLSGQFSVQLIDGTGFFVDEDGDFVTAGHVITDLQTPSLQRPVPCVMAIYVPNGNWQREAINFDVKWYMFTDCKKDVTLDLAVCKTTTKIPTKITPLIIEDIRPPDGSAVAFTGFPLGTVEPLSSRLNIATYRGATDTEGSRDLILDKWAWPGASGSPVYDSRGVVVGVVLARGLADSIGISFARPSHFLLKFLRDNGVRPVAAADKRKKRQK